MSNWHTDNHGLAFKTRNAKIYANGNHTWAMKLAMLHHTEGDVRIITYSLPQVEYTVRLLERRPERVYIICHDKFLDRARAIKDALPGLFIACAPAIHSKIALISPETIYVTSANFGHSGWHETTLGVRSSEAHDWYVEQSFKPLWAKAAQIG